MAGQERQREYMFTQDRRECLNLKAQGAAGRTILRRDRVTTYLASQRKFNKEPVGEQVNIITPFIQLAENVEDIMGQTGRDVRNLELITQLSYSSMADARQALANLGLRRDLQGTVKAFITAYMGMEANNLHTYAGYQSFQGARVEIRQSSPGRQLHSSSQLLPQPDEVEVERPVFQSLRVKIQRIV